MLNIPSKSRITNYFPFESGNGGGTPPINTIYESDGIVLTGSNYIELGLLQRNGYFGLRERFYIRLLVNRTGSYTILSGGAFGGEAACVSVVSDVFYVYGVSTGVAATLGEYYEITAGGDSTQAVYINAVSIGNYASGNSAPKRLENCTCFEIMTGYGNESTFLNDATVVASIYADGAGALAELVTSYYNGFNELGNKIGTIPANCGNHYRFNADLLKNENYWQIIRGFYAIYHGSTPSFIHKKGLIYT